jgi:hypothetical protein
MRRPLLLLLVLAVAPSLYAIEPSTAPVKGDRVGVLPIDARYSTLRGVSSLLPKYIAQEMRRAGFDAHVLRRDRDEIDSKTGRDDFYVEVVEAESEGDGFGGIGAVSSNGVGVEVDVVAAHVAAEVRLYDAEMQLIDTYELAASAVSPTISGIGVGGRDGFLFLSLPWFSHYPHRLAAHELAKNAVRKMTTTE